MVTVIVVPVVVLAMMFIVQAGLAYHARQVVAGAAQDGAATGSRHGADEAAGAATAEALVDAAASQLLTASDVTATSDGNTVTMTVTGTVIQVLPIFPAFNVSATSSASVEQFRPQPGVVP
jgi:Flp pilus assembly protein TadG